MLKNKVVEVNAHNLAKNLWEPQIYQILISKNYVQMLSWHYQNGSLTFNKSGVAKFNFSAQQKVADQDWFETYWYWFGYARIHLTSRTIDNILEGSDTASEIAEIIDEISPELAPIAMILALWLLANGIILKKYDRSHGSYIGIYLPALTVVDYGSN